VLFLKSLSNALTGHVEYWNWAGTGISVVGSVTSRGAGAQFSSGSLTALQTSSAE